MAQQFTQKMANDLASQLASSLSCLLESLKAEQVQRPGLILGDQTLLDIKSGQKLVEQYDFFKAQLPE